MRLVGGETAMTISSYEEQINEVFFKLYIGVRPGVSMEQNEELKKNEKSSI